MATKAGATMKIHIRLATSAAAAGCLTLAATLFGATPANAWVWDPHVRITGLAWCTTVPNAAPVPAREITIRVRATGEARTVPVNGFTGYYGADFYRLPVNGSWADETIHCVYPGMDTWRYGRAAFMFRPSYGTEIWGYNMTS
jgi:hypothetical protein